MSISALGSSVAGSLFPANQNGIKRPEDFESSDDFVSSVISNKDSDGDGQLNIDEAEFLGDIFNEIDSDGDGNLSQEEMVADLEKRQQQMAAMGRMSMAMGGSQQNLLDSLMSELDSDGDSRISKEESGLGDELFSALDTDSDGSISGEELAEGMSSMPLPEGMGNVAASSGFSSSSGSSSEGSEEEYDEYDYNKDGVVTADELQRAFAMGDASLADMVGQDNSGNAQEEGQSMLQRMALKAYQNQTGEMYSGTSLGATA